MYSRDGYRRCMRVSFTCFTEMGRGGGRGEGTTGREVVLHQAGWLREQRDMGGRGYGGGYGGKRE